MAVSDGATILALYIANKEYPNDLYSHCPCPFHKLTTESLKHVELLNCWNFIRSSTSDQYRVKDAMHKLVP